MLIIIAAKLWKIKSFAVRRFAAILLYEWGLASEILSMLEKHAVNKTLHSSLTILFPCCVI